MPPDTPPGSADLRELLRTIEPVRHAGVYVFATVPDDRRIDASAVLASIREPEGLSVILAEEDAAALGLRAVYRSAWITLTVPSSLNAVGLTAAVAGALAKDGISCNVVAGLHHDHLFVAADACDAAMAVLHALQAAAQ